MAPGPKSSPGGRDGNQALAPAEGRGGQWVIGSHPRLPMFCGPGPVLCAVRDEKTVGKRRELFSTLLCRHRASQCRKVGLDSPISGTES